MPAVSSEIIDDRIIGGDRFVEMRFVDTGGRACYCTHRVDEGDDPMQMMANQTPSIEAQLTEIKNAPQPLPPQPEVVLGEGPPTLSAAHGQFYYDTTDHSLYVNVGGTW